MDIPWGEPLDPNVRRAARFHQDDDPDPTRHTAHQCQLQSELHLYQQNPAIAIWTGAIISSLSIAYFNGLKNAPLTVNCKIVEPDHVNVLQNLYDRYIHYYIYCYVFIDLDFNKLKDNKA